MYGDKLSLDNCKYKRFYSQINRDDFYGNPAKFTEDHSAYRELYQFIQHFNLEKKRCLEIGSSKGIFQYIVEDYSGLDIEPSLARYYQKPYFTINDDGTYPFPDGEFDAIWSIAVHEHIPDLELALRELKRVLKPGGLVFLKPAWQCPSWNADGYPVRPYRDFDFKGKVIKASIPIRRSVLWRALFIFPKRVIRHILFLTGLKYKEIQYNKIKPNYEIYWMSDSDACNSIDPHDAILWFESNGFDCLSHPLHWRAFFVRSGALVMKKTYPETFFR